MLYKIAQIDVEETHRSPGIWTHALFLRLISNRTIIYVEKLSGRTSSS